MRLGFDGRVALVTGGAGGIGAAVARELAAEGARVILLDRDLDAALRIRDELVDAGREATAIRCELADPADLDAALDEVNAAGPVTAVCLNAGVGSLGTIETLLLEEWQRTLAVNLESNLRILRRVIGPMRDAGGGSIVAVSSLGARIADHPESSPAYGVSKAGLERLMLDAARRHAGDGIRANSVRPGPVATGFVENRLPGPTRTVDVARPEVARGDPADVAAVIAFLLSDRARLITGQAITADAGFSHLVP